MTKQVVKKQEKAQVTISQFLNRDAVSTFLEKQLKGKKNSFVSNLIALSDNDKNLAECDPDKLMKCAMNATALDLSLNKNLGYAYVIAYKGVPQFQIGYKGLYQLAMRSGAYKYINAVEVREGEIKRNKFTGITEFLGENPDGEVIGYLASFELLNGFTQSIYMSSQEIEDYAMKYSQAYQYDKRYGKTSSKWSDPSARGDMALKTVLKRLLNKWGVLSVELEAAFDNDNDAVEDVPHEVVSNNSNTETVEAEVIEQKEESDSKSVDLNDL